MRTILVLLCAVDLAEVMTAMRRWLDEHQVQPLLTLSPSGLYALTAPSPSQFSSWISWVPEALSSINTVLSPNCRWSNMSQRCCRARVPALSRMKR